MAKRLTKSQLEYLQSQPFGDAPNKINLALALTNQTGLALSRVTGLTVPDISRIRNGKYDRISLVRCQVIALAFGCGIDDLFPMMTEFPPKRVIKKGRW